MKLYTIYLTILLGVTAVLLSGCAHYTAQPLNKLSHTLASVEQNQSISFSHKVFSSRDCKKYLDRNVFSHGYQPIHITIINNSDRYFYISKSQFTIPCVSYKEVAQKAYTSTKRRALGYGITGLFVWPFLIPALVDGLGSAEANKKLDIDFKNKALRDQVINPYSTASGLIFVPTNSLDSDFGFVLIDNTTDERFVLTTNTNQMRIH